MLIQGKSLPGLAFFYVRAAGRTHLEVKGLSSPGKEESQPNGKVSWVTANPEEAEGKALA